MIRKQRRFNLRESKQIHVAEFLDGVDLKSYYLDYSNRIDFINYLNNTRKIDTDKKKTKEEWEELFQEYLEDLLTIDEYIDKFYQYDNYKEVRHEILSKGIYTENSYYCKYGWDDVFDFYLYTYEDEEDDDENYFKAELTEDGEIIEVEKVDGYWYASDGTKYMGYLTPDDITDWLSKRHNQNCVII